VLIIWESKYMCISAFHFNTALPCYYTLHIIYFCTCWVPTISVLTLAISPCYTNLLFRRWRWTGILRWGVVGLRCSCGVWSLPLFCFVRVTLVSDGHYLYNSYTLFVIFGYLWTLLIHVYGINDRGHTCDEYSILAKKIGYGRSGTRAVSTVGMLA
jgi:hypothetical protein